MKPFRVGRARSEGMPESRIRSRTLSAPFHGVRAAHGVELDVHALAHAYAVKMRRDAVFSHATGASLIGLPLPVRFAPSPLHVTVPARTAPVRGRGVVGHHTSAAAPSIDVGGLRVMSPGDLWVTLGGALDVPDLVAVADALVTAGRRRPAWCTIDDLHTALSARPRARGRRSLRVALPLVRVGSASRPESLLRVLLVGAGFPEPELNYRVPGLPYLVDLVWPQFGFGIEYDGAHHFSDQQRRADHRRQELIHDGGVLLMRVQKDELFDDPYGLTRRARRRIAARGGAIPAREISQKLLPRR